MSDKYCFFLLPLFYKFLCKTLIAIVTLLDPGDVCLRKIESTLLEGLTQATGFLAKQFFKKYSLIYIFLYEKITLSSIVTLPYVWDDKLNKLESTILEDDSTQVSAILAKRFLKRKFKRLLYLFLSKKYYPPPLPLWPYPTPRNDHMTKQKSTVPENVFA